ncbi:probable serine/threonine-protein kinase PBL19 [Oryza brachyantha]|uniref:probable serine/threonine-protein kinase PBL19 n=1 Tax=Oryza brachyantha TaxID=4533 RepID=UPI001ADB50F7|nr:probable serine/threonine-protein kinase PBL19 [Oryza brachyantha]
MGCLCLFQDKCRIKKRSGITAPAPASPPAAVGIISSAVSTEAGSNVSVPAAPSSTCTSSWANATNCPSESSSAGARPSASSSSARSTPELYDARQSGPRELALRELRGATGNFSPLLMVGQGGFGCVYRGVLRLPSGPPHGTPVAVKRLNLDSRQGHKEWLAEVQLLGVLEHPNLVKLVGYCASQTERGQQRLLVYEFVPNKTLDDHLFDRSHPVLPWGVRLRVALGAAEGLLYLHEGLEFQIIYRDFKAANVLLDEEFRPKLSDFGLAREGPSEGQTHVSTAVMGTYGYAAPDYVRTGHLTAKSDVWSFGVVLYEILTGRRSIEKSRPKEEQKLLEWVRRHPAESAQFGRIMDVRLQGRYSMRAAAEVAELAAGCLAKHGKDRPAMAEVVERLRRATQHDELDGEVYPPPEESSPLCQEAEAEAEALAAEDDVAVAAAAARRRMLHLAALGENANAHARRRLMLMRAAAAATAAT